ncbi:MAG: hypothetical protein JWO48_3756, partial [Bryobacterales bacterium]|nr:hypothetical protein [Bryobacterales bacterium]
MKAPVKILGTLSIVISASSAVTAASIATEGARPEFSLVQSGKRSALAPVEEVQPGGPGRSGESGNSPPRRQLAQAGAERGGDGASLPGASGGRGGDPGGPGAARTVQLGPTLEEMLADPHLVSYCEQLLHS